MTAGGVSIGSFAKALSLYIPTPLADPSNPITGYFNDGGYVYHADTGGFYCIMAYKTPENMHDFPSSTYELTRCGGVGGDGQCTTVSYGVPTNTIFVSPTGLSTGC